MISYIHVLLSTIRCRALCRSDRRLLWTNITVGIFMFVASSILFTSRRSHTVFWICWTPKFTRTLQTALSQLFAVSGKSHYDVSCHHGYKSNHQYTSFSVTSPVCIYVNLRYHWCAKVAIVRWKVFLAWISELITLRMAFQLVKVGHCTYLAKHRCRKLNLGGLRPLHTLVTTLFFNTSPCIAPMYNSYLK